MPKRPGVGVGIMILKNNKNNQKSPLGRFLVDNVISTTRIKAVL